jgi:ATP-dependent Clp protease ATP-binding subunit ClpA
MVELALPRQLHSIGQRARAAASLRRAGTVEAEHLLLAILAERDGPTARRLKRGGLDYDTLSDALDAERARSLRAAGVAPIPAASLAANPRTARPGWGASIRDVLRVAEPTSAKDDRPGALELELTTAILSPRLGTVPRALALAGFDRLELLAELSTATKA